ncbi:MAG: nuclear transport factor 2 family protein [Polyangia bacterium]
MSDVQALVDHQRIIDAVTDYAIGIDLRDWDLLAGSLADEVEVDFTSWGGGRNLSLFTAPKIVSGRAWADGVRRSMSAFRSTHHLLGTFRVHLDEGVRDEGAPARARCHAHVQANHYMPNDRGDNDFTLGGYYDNELVQDASGRWRITRLKLVVLWSRGNRFVFELAYEAGS